MGSAHEKNLIAHIFACGVAFQKILLDDEARIFFCLSSITVESVFNIAKFLGDGFTFFYFLQIFLFSLP